MFLKYGEGHVLLYVISLSKAGFPLSFSQPLLDLSHELKIPNYATSMVVEDQDFLNGARIDTVVEQRGTQKGCDSRKRSSISYISANSMCSLQVPGYMIRSREHLAARLDWTCRGEHRNSHVIGRLGVMDPIMSIQVSFELRSVIANGAFLLWVIMSSFLVLSVSCH